MKQFVKRMLDVCTVVFMLFYFCGVPAYAENSCQNFLKKNARAPSPDTWIKLEDNQYETSATFSKQQYTNGLIFYGSDDMSITVSMSEITNSGWGDTYFSVQLIKLDENDENAAEYLHKFRINGNTENTTTLTWANVGAGAYQIVFEKDSTNILWQQKIGKIIIVGL